MSCNFENFYFAIQSLLSYLDSNLNEIKKCKKLFSQSSLTVFTLIVRKTEKSEVKANFVSFYVLKRGSLAYLYQPFCFLSRIWFLLESRRGPPWLHEASLRSSCSVLRKNCLKYTHCDIWTGCWKLQTCYHCRKSKYARLKTTPGQAILIRFTVELNAARWK